MDFFWTTTRKDFKRQWRDPVSLLIWIGIPLIIGLLIILASGGKSGPRPQAHVLVADEDDSFLSDLLIGALSQDAAGGLIRTENVETQEGQFRMDKGDATALLVIPEGFSDAILLEEPVVLHLITNPSQTILPEIVEEGLSLVVDGVFYIHRLIGDDLRAFAGGTPEGLNTFPDEQISNFSVRVNHLVENLGHYLDPPLIELETSVAETESQENETSLGLFFVPGILFMSLLFMAQGISADLWREREQKTLRRVVISPRSIWAFLLGKVLSGFSLMLIVSLIGLSIGYAYFSLSPQTLPLAALWATFSGTMLLITMTLIQLLSSSQRGGEILTLAIVFPLIMLGGSFFPFEAMPRWMVSVGTRTPNGWALQQLKAILTQRVELESIGLAFLGLLAVTIVLFWMSVWRLRTKFALG